MTGALHRGLTDRGITLAYPRVDGFELRLHRVGDRSELHPAFRGLLEPLASGPVVDLRALDLIVVPGVAFTAGGVRLGQGGGYYDRLLESLAGRAMTVGVCFEVQLAAALPSAPHDQPVDLVITEQGPVAPY